MKYIKLIAILMVVVMIMLPGSNYLYARGGGHFGGGRMGGGWSGGRGGFEHGGGEFHGGGEGDRGHHDDHGRHSNNNNNNSGNNVNVYGGGGDWGWGVADGAIAGLAVGAAIGASSQPSTVIIEQQAPISQQAVARAPAYGTQVTTLPPGCVARNVNGTMAYECGPVWYRPFFGSSGVYYEVVQPPPAEPKIY